MAKLAKLHHIDYKIQDEGNPTERELIEMTTILLSSNINPMRGDLIECTTDNYQNDGLMIFDGTNILDLASEMELDTYGHLPSEFHVLEPMFPPRTTPKAIVLCRMKQNSSLFEPHLIRLINDFYDDNFFIPETYWHGTDPYNDNDPDHVNNKQRLITHNTLVWFNHLTYQDQLIANAWYDSKLFGVPMIYTWAILPDQSILYICEDWFVDDCSTSSVLEYITKLDGLNTYPDRDVVYVSSLLDAAITSQLTNFRRSPGVKHYHLTQFKRILESQLLIWFYLFFDQKSISHEKVAQLREKGHHVLIIN